MSCGCSSTPCGCNTPNIPRGPRGFAGPAGPAPNITIGDVTSGPAAATITGTSPNLVLDLTIPPGATGPAGAPGANGQDATELFTNLVSFTVPGLNSSTVATVGDTSWMVDGGWLYIEGAGYFIIVNVLSPTTVQIANPGSVLGWPAGIPGQAAPTTVIPSTATPNQVIQAAVPGLPGATGATGPGGSNGPSGFIEVVNTIPTVAPAPGGEFKIYTDSSTAPTVVTGYSWNGVSWAATANLTPVAGSQIYSVTGIPAGAFGKNGDWAFNTVTLEVYYKTAGTWTNPFDLSATFTQVAVASSNYMGTAPLHTDGIVGFDPLASTFNTPITYTIDLSKQGHSIESDKNVTLDWDDTSFTYGGVWELQVENIDGASTINLILTAGRFAENATLAISSPIALAAGDTRMFVFRKNKAGNRLIIENTYLVNNL
jgi:hypothetical protein